jgi:lysozyme
MKRQLLIFLFFVSCWNYLPAQSILGIDVSGSAQGTINWSQVAASGKTFAWAKATEGFTFNDAKFTTNMSGGTAAGLIMGAYHFARPDNNSAVNEANHFLSIASSHIGPGKLPPALDIEDPSSTIILQNLFTSAQLTTWIQTWLTTVQNATGVAPVIYTNSNYAAYLGSSLNGYKLWIAKPDGSATTPPTGLGNWSTWSIKQYSWTGTVSGISGAVDLDVFNGNTTAFNSFISLNTASVQSFSISPATISQCNNCFTITYSVNAPSASTVMLGASIRQTGTTTWIDDTPHDVKLNIPAGNSTQTRTFCITSSTTAGSYDVIVALWLDNNNNNQIDAGDTQLNSQQTSSMLTVTSGTLSAPISNSGSNISANGFTANWANVTGATSYNLDVSTNNSFSSFVGSYNNFNVSNVNSYSVTGLSCNSTYYYRIRATNANCGPSGNSNVTSVNTSACCSAPQVPIVTPSGPIAVCQGANATLTISNPCSGCTYNWSDGGTGTTHLVSVNGGYYAWSQNTCGQSTPSNTVSVVISSSAPSTPGPIAGNNTVSVGQTVQYSISPVTGANNYTWTLNVGSAGVINLNGTASTSITWNNPGNYILSVNALNGCGNSNNQSLAITVSSVTGIVNPDNEFSVTLFPNPTSGEFILKAEGLNHQKVNVEILSASGQKVYQQQFKADGNNFRKSISLSNMASGIYTLRIIIDDRVYIRKVTKL